MDKILGHYLYYPMDLSMWLPLTEDSPKHASSSQFFKEQGGTLRTSRAIQLGMLFGTPVRSNNLAAASTDSPQHRPSQARSGSYRNSHSSRRSLPHSALASHRLNTQVPMPSTLRYQPCADSEDRWHPSSGSSGIPSLLSVRALRSLLSTMPR